MIKRPQNKMLNILAIENKEEPFTAEELEDVDNLIDSKKSITNGSARAVPISISFTSDDDNGKQPMTTSISVIANKIYSLERVGRTIDRLKMSRRAITNLLTLIDDNGGYLCQPMPYEDIVLMGYPVDIDDSLPLDRINCSYMNRGDP